MSLGEDVLDNPKGTHLELEEEKVTAKEDEKERSSEEDEYSEEEEDNEEDLAEEPNLSEDDEGWTGKDSRVRSKTSIFDHMINDDGSDEDVSDREENRTEMVENDKNEHESDANIGERVSEKGEEKKNPELKKLTPEQLAKEQKRIKKTGVCYLSRIPPYMKPAKLRSIMSNFGRVDRLFLKPEDINVYRRRVKSGGNKKKNYTEGWVEFVNKSDAKMCAATLNGNKIGGKKTSYYHDDILNVLYLPGFKWMDLTQQISKENEIREAKLALELSQQQKLNKDFIRNVEKSKMVNNIQKKRKAKQNQNEDENVEKLPRRPIKQKKITSSRASAEDEIKQKNDSNKNLGEVLNHIF